MVSFAIGGGFTRTGGTPVPEIGKQRYSLHEIYFHTHLVQNPNIETFTIQFM